MSQGFCELSLEHFGKTTTPKQFTNLKKQALFHLIT